MTSTSTPVPVVKGGDLAVGDAEGFLHAHIRPPYEWEPHELVARPVWLYSPDHWTDPVHRLGAARDLLRSKLAAQVVGLRDSVEFRLDV